MKHIEIGDYIHFDGPSSNRGYINSWGIVANITNQNNKVFIRINFFDYRIHRLKQSASPHNGLLPIYITKNAGKYNFKNFQLDYPEYSF